MAKFVMLGRYSVEAIKSASGERTKKAVSLIKKLKGSVEGIYALLGVYDLLILADFPGINEAVKASIELSKMTDISFSTFPALSVEDFDKLLD
ncbi:MAG: GYD domain-containing protein [Candidatus Omnitrophica bacterium]|nr:GYD domain-containing protein [Candidatus Omnitrophota bacterium]